MKASEFVATQFPQRPALVDGIFRTGDKVLFASASKAGKTWFTLDLALCIASGRKWFGYQTTQARVLYANFELHPDTMQDRLNVIRDAMKLPESALENLEVWNLRGYRVTLERLVREIADESIAPGLIILDPLYKLVGDRNEKEANMMADLFAELEAVAREKSAAIWIPAHFSKGNQSEKEVLDRASGSGVLARDPDCYMSLTPHQEEHCFTLDAVCRSFASPESVVLKWSYPLFDVTDLDPKNLKKQVGRSSKYNLKAFVDLVKHPMTCGEWQAAAERTFGMPKRTFHDYLDRALSVGAIAYDEESKKYQKP